MLTLALLKAHWKKLVVIAAMVLSFILGYTARSPQVSSDKNVQTEDTVDQNNIVTTTTKKPDGTTTTVVVDKSKVVDDNKDVDTKVVADAKKNYSAGFWVETPVSLQIQSTYRVELERRLIGDLWGGASVNTNKAVGLGLKFEW